MTTFVSIRRAAKITGASENSLRKLFHAGQLPGYNNPSGRYFHVNLPELCRQLGVDYAAAIERAESDGSK